MKIAALSDLHGHLPDVPPCDLLLIGGDITPLKDHELSFQAEWLDTTFRAWLQRVPARKIVATAGNHDFVFQHEPGWVPKDLPWTYLQDSGCQWEGLNLWGTPWQPWFFDWAFNLYEPDLAKKWELIPEGTDVLVLHGPPEGYGDWVREGGGMKRVGSPSLTERIKKVSPRVVIFGHIHEGRGEWLLGRTVLANVSIVNSKYQHVHSAWTHELADDAKAGATA